MIIYTKNSFGLNLLFRVHGSAVYRAVTPALMSVGVYFLFTNMWQPSGEVLHPYAIGILIGGITFLIIFRLTQSYGRYWEATSCTYRMMSKWMDAAIHIAGYHLQSSQYDSIKPPSYRDYPELNAMFLTRDRERFRTPSSFFYYDSKNDGMGNSDDDDDNDDDRSQRSFVSPKGKISQRRAQLKSINTVKNPTRISKKEKSAPRRDRRRFNHRSFRSIDDNDNMNSSNHDDQRSGISVDSVTSGVGVGGGSGKETAGSAATAAAAIATSIRSRSNNILPSTSSDEFSLELVESARDGDHTHYNEDDDDGTTEKQQQVETTTTTTKNKNPEVVRRWNKIRDRVSSSHSNTGNIINHNNSPVHRNLTAQRISTRNFESAQQLGEPISSSSPSTRIKNEKQDAVVANGDQHSAIDDDVDGYDDDDDNDDNDDHDENEKQQEKQSIQIRMLHPRSRLPRFLTGRPRMDGNWGPLFDDGKTTYWVSDKKGGMKYDRRGFASIKGGRTPPLFLQELAHLTSLLNAVALSTLRNDVEGVESPLDLYEVGAPWPPVDPGDDEYLYDSTLERYWNTFLYFCGKGRTPEARTRYNKARPLPVLGGVSDSEIACLQIARGPYAKTQLCWSWLSEFITREHIAGSLGQVGAPIISRVKQFTSDGMANYNMARKIMFIPFPFPHAQLSSLFVNLMIILVPLLMEQYTDVAAMGACLTFASVLCLSGIHEVARELENPFRNVPNELPVVTFQAEFNEALITMYAGFHPDFFWEPPTTDVKQTSRQKAIPPSFQGVKSSCGPDTIVEESIENDSSHQTVGQGSERTTEMVDGSDIVQGSDADLVRIVEQQGRMLEQMLEEQARLNKLIQQAMARKTDT